MKTIKTMAVLSFMAMLSLGVASCFNPSGPGNGGTGSGDTVRHGRLPIDTVHDTLRHHHHRIGTNDTLIGNDTLIHRDTLPPPPPPPPPDSGGLDSTTLDSLLGHH